MGFAFASIIGLESKKNKDGDPIDFDWKAHYIMYTDLLKHI